MSLKSVTQIDCLQCWWRERDRREDIYKIKKSKHLALFGGKHFDTFGNFPPNEDATLSTEWRVSFN